MATVPKQYFTSTVNVGNISCATTGNKPCASSFDLQGAEQYFENNGMDGKGNYELTTTNENGLVSTLTLNKSQLDSIFKTSGAVSFDKTKGIMTIDASSQAKQGKKDTQTHDVTALDFSQNPNLKQADFMAADGKTPLDGKSIKTMLYGYASSPQGGVTLKQFNTKGDGTQGNQITLTPQNIKDLPDTAFTPNGIDISSLKLDTKVGQGNVSLDTHFWSGAKASDLDKKSDADIIKTLKDSNPNGINLDNIKDPNTGNPMSISVKDFQTLADQGKITINHTPNTKDGSKFSISVDYSTLPQYSKVASHWTDQNTVHSSDGTEWQISQDSSNSTSSSTSNSTSPQQNQSPSSTDPSYTVVDGDSLSVVASKLDGGDSSKDATILAKLEQQVNAKGDNPNFVIHVGNTFSYKA